MNQLALALRAKPGWRFFLRITGMFAILVCCVNLMQMLVWLTIPGYYPGFHVWSWSCWFLWQGFVFPRARNVFLAGCRAPYATAFWTNIWPGVCWGLSHMTLPVLLALQQMVAVSAGQVMVGTSITGVGLTLLIAGFRTIGPARAGFLAEYVHMPIPLKCRSIYSVMRHPLFVGGALVSAGSTLCLTSDPQLLIIATLNVAILPVYRTIEDRRLTSVFGAHYANYVDVVPGILPRPQHLIRAFGQRTYGADN